MSIYNAVQPTVYSAVFNSVRSVGIKSEAQLIADWINYTSGLTEYRRGVNDLTNLYELQYSDDGGSTWETLVSQQTDEDTIIQDNSNLYRHRIVGTAYHIDQTLTAIGYDGIEDTDWENIYST